jgi:hypothetical protein
MEERKKKKGENEEAVKPGLTCPLEEKGRGW